MTTNDIISKAFDYFGLETTGFRTDDEATTRMAQTWQAVVSVSDHMQGRGQNVKIKDATTLDVRITTRRDHVEALEVAPCDLTQALDGLIRELNRW